MVLQRTWLMYTLLYVLVQSNFFYLLYKWIWYWVHFCLHLATNCLWRWEPDRRFNFFFNPHAHLCAVTYITEISLYVTLSNRSHSHSPDEHPRRRTFLGFLILFVLFWFCLLVFSFCFCGGRMVFVCYFFNLLWLLFHRLNKQYPELSDLCFYIQYKCSTDACSY